MAYKQYIGARYVPKIVGEWTEDTSYEALSVVTYNYASYTSKKPVPHTVGNPADNPEYWVCTAEYNAQVAQYAEQVSEYKSEVDGMASTVQEVSENMKTLSGTVTSLGETVADQGGRIETLESQIHEVAETNMILITDSYGHQNSGASVSTFFPTIVKNKLGLDNNHFRSSAQSGAGFGNNEFLTQLQSVAADMTTEQKEAVTDILVCGGWNDSDTSQSYGSDSAFNNGINAFDSFARSTFPNARINLAMISWGDSKLSNSFNASSQMPLALKRYSDAAASKSWRFLKNCEWILHTYASGIWQADGNHPAQAGQDLLGKYIAAAFVNGVIDIFRYESALDIRSGFSFFIKQHNEVTELTIIPTNNSSPYTAFETTVDLNGTSEYEFFNASSLSLMRLRGGYARFSGFCTLTQGGTNALLPVQFSFEGRESGKIYARFLGNQHGSSASTIYMWWLGGSYTFSTMNC